MPLPEAVEEALVELGVRVEEALDVVRVGELGHLLDEALHGVEVHLRELRHGQADRHHLERLANLVRLDELVAREGADDGAAARADGHEALRGEPPECFPDRSPADAERGGESHLVQLGPGSQRPGDDLVAEVVVDPLPERAVVEHARRLAWASPFALVECCIERRRGDITAPLGVNRRQSTLTLRQSPGNRAP